jgi:hypothetical protein
MSLYDGNVPIVFLVVTPRPLDGDDRAGRLPDQAHAERTQADLDSARRENSYSVNA